MPGCFWRGWLAATAVVLLVVSDGGGEFRGAFDALLSSLFIDHRTTSANHPHANGLAERAVQTLTRAIRKHSETAKEDSVWDMAVPYIMLGCNSSIQASTGLSPYEVMYGVPPTGVVRSPFTTERGVWTWVMARKRVDPKTTPNAIMLTTCKMPNQKRGSAPRHNKTIKMQNAEANANA